MTVFPKDTKTLGLSSVTLNDSEASTHCSSTKDVQRRTEWTRVHEMTDHVKAGKVNSKHGSEEEKLMSRSEESEEHSVAMDQDEPHYKEQNSKLAENANEEKKTVAGIIQQESGKSDLESDAKPSHSYIALIAMAILSKPSKKVLLGDIYNYISDKFPYYRSKDKSWRNSIRHNLSLNECFIKAGRSENGKGNYWAIHPANLEDFANGDFRRRRARRRVRKTHNSLCTRYSSLAGYPQQAGFMNYRAMADQLSSYPVAAHYPSFYAVTPYNCVRKSSFAIENLLSSRIPPPPPAAVSAVEHYAPISPPLCANSLLRAGGGGGYPVTTAASTYPPTLSPPTAMAAITTPYLPFPAPIHQVPTESWNDTWRKLKAQFQVRS